MKTLKKCLIVDSASVFIALMLTGCSAFDSSRRKRIIPDRPRSIGRASRTYLHARVQKRSLKKS